MVGFNENKDNQAYAKIQATSNYDNNFKRILFYKAVDCSIVLWNEEFCCNFV